MTQIIINTGEVANDGTGESLRNAFDAVNDNFSNIWAAGPVDSQVQISNNVVSTNETNLELILRGNGIGTVTLSSTTVPGIDGVYNLGNITRQFDSTYSRFFYGNGRFLSGIATGGSGGNVYFSATPPLNPQLGDIWIDSETAVQYLYFSDNTSNQWAEMQAYQSFSTNPGTGNVDLAMINSNVVPQMSNVWALGNVTNQWNELWVSDTVTVANTVYADRVTTNILRSDDSTFVLIEDGINVDGHVLCSGTITADSAVLGNSSTVTTDNYSIGYRDVPQILLTANTVIGINDGGKHYYSVASTEQTLTIANNTAVSWAVGTEILVVNRGTGNIVLAQSTGVELYLAGNSTAANRIVSSYGMATLLNVSANVWMLQGTAVI